MKTFLKIEIEVTDNNPKHCHVNCTFLDKFFDECRLFQKELCGGEDSWIRCKECLEKEDKNEIPS